MIPAGSTVKIPYHDPVIIGETVSGHCIISGGNGYKYQCTDHGKQAKLNAFHGASCDGKHDTYDVVLNGVCHSDLCIGYIDVECFQSI